MTSASDVTIVGAGPYGLSIAAHLRGLGVDCRAIGTPMESWQSKMPRGMLLKSPGFASNLYDLDRSFTLRQFCRDHGILYDDVDIPIPLETFSAYGIAFQKRFVPNLENEKLVNLSQCSKGFDLRMENGKSFRTRKVVLAVGLDYFRRFPEPLAHLDGEQLSHSAEHHDLRRFRGRHVAVLGSGASAIDIAVLLHEAQAEVQLIARKPTVSFDNPWAAGSRPLLKRICRPLSGIGPGWKKRLVADFPWLFRYLPDDYRLRIARTFLGPSGGWPMKDRAAPIPLLLGYSLQEARVSDSGVQLRLSAADGSSRHVKADHVIAATGYNADLCRLPFLNSTTLERLRLVGKTPRLSVNFESSIPGLYFVGPVSATTFGPVMRFAVGADFTSRRISRHLMRT